MMPGVCAWILVVLRTNPKVSVSFANVSVRIGSWPGSSTSLTRGMTRLYAGHSRPRDAQSAIAEQAGHAHRARQTPHPGQLGRHPARAIEAVGRGPRLARLFAVEPDDPVGVLARPLAQPARQLEEERRAGAAVVGAHE